MDRPAGRTPTKEAVRSPDKVEGLSAAPRALPRILVDVPLLPHDLDALRTQPVWCGLTPATGGIPSRFAGARTPERQIQLAAREPVFGLALPTPAAVWAPVAPLYAVTQETTPSAHPFVMQEILVDFFARHSCGAAQWRQNDHVRCLAQTSAGTHTADQWPAAAALLNRPQIRSHQSSLTPSSPARFTLHLVNLALVRFYRSFARYASPWRSVATVLP